MKNIRKRAEDTVGGIALRYSWFYSILLRIFPCWKKVEIKDLYSFCLQENFIVEMIENLETRCYKAPPKQQTEYEDWKYNDFILRKVTKQYLACVENGIVVGKTDGIFTEKYYLTDKIIFDKKGFVEHLPHCLSGTDKECIVKYRHNKIIKIPKAIHLIKMWSHNYFHLMLETLSRLWVLEDKEEYADWPLLIDEVVKKDPRNLEIIDMLNKRHREIIWVGINDYVLVEKLLVLPEVSWAIWDVAFSVKYGLGYLIDSKAGLYLRNTILHGYHVKKSYNCVYVARGNNKRLVNESEIIDFFSGEGFEIFYPERATFTDEVDCFSSANCIVLCTGAANTNLIFCKQTAAIYAIVPFKFRADSPEDITAVIGVNVHLRDAVLLKDENIMMYSEFEFPIEKCAGIVEDCKRKGYL